MKKIKNKQVKGFWFKRNSKARISNAALKKKTSMNFGSDYSKLYIREAIKVLLYSFFILPTHTKQRFSIETDYKMIQKLLKSKSNPFQNKLLSLKMFIILSCFIQIYISILIYIYIIYRYIYR